ncbi:hypothetical protein ACFY36_43875 [Actinoplanes sp. NPDC000266]
MSSNAYSATAGTVRYALGSNARTARLAMLIAVAILAWHLML